MTDLQQNKIANAIIPRIRGLLSEAVTTESGEAKLVKLKEISKLIDAESAIRNLPVEWMEYFGPAGLTSDTTVLVCGYIQDTQNIWSTLVSSSIVHGTRRVFKNRERNKHAEIEMLEWILTQNNVRRHKMELRIAFSRSPCENCLKRIIDFKKGAQYPSMNIRIGFANWYRGSNLHQMYESMIDLGINYSILTQKEMKSRDFSPLFDFSGFYNPLIVGLNALHLDSDSRWEKVMEQAWEDCYKRTEQQHVSCSVHLGTDSRRKKLDALRVKVLNKETVRKARAVRMMLNMFGVRFAFWKWHDCTKREISKRFWEDLFRPVRRSRKDKETLTEKH